MKLIVNRIVAEFNKIFTGTKRVGDSLRLEGRRMSALDVANAATLGYKTESALSVNKAVLADKSVSIQSFNSSGIAVVDGNGNPVYIKEHQLSVNNSQYLRGVEPVNLEVDIARRLKVGTAANSPIINVSSLIDNAAAYRVKDSSLLGGKLESALNVSTAVTADNALKVNNKLESALVVEKARVATKLISDDVGNPERYESALNVNSAVYIKSGSTFYTAFGLKEYVLGLYAANNDTVDAKKIYVDLAASSNTLTTGSGNKSFADIISYIKTDSTVEAYKATRLITGTGGTAVARTGDEYKTWLLAHADFTTTVGTLNANTANRAVRFGDATTNYNVTEMDARIKATVVDTASNALKLENNTVENIITTVRSRILTNVTTDSNNLTQTEVTNFFTNARVVTAVQSIKVSSAVNSDTVGTKTVANIIADVQSTGQVLSAKYIYADPATGGQKSFIDITNAINQAKTDLTGTATTAANTLGKIEGLISTNATAASTLVSTEATNRTNADNTLQTNINTEKGRIDTILSGADSDKNTFSKIKSYVDGLTGSLSTSTTTLSGGTTQNVVNITNALETRLASVESSSSNNASNLGTEVDKIETAVGLASNGQLANITGKNYVNTAVSVMGAVYLLDTALKAEESSRISGDSTVLGVVDTNKGLLDGEISRAKGVEGTLTSLTTTVKTSLVNAINEVVSNLSSEATTRTNADDALSTRITTNTTDLSTEVSRAKGVEGTLTTLSTTVKTSLVEAVNEVFTKVNTETTRAQNAESTLTTTTSTLTTNLTNEINNRTSADTTLQNNINAVATNLTTEITNRTNSEGDKTTLTTTAKTTLVAAINEVKSTANTAVSNEATSRSTADTTLQNNINTEKGRIDKVVTGLGFTNIDTNGAIVFSGTTYLNAQTTALNAFKTLDETVRSNVAVLNGRADGIVTQINNVLGINSSTTAYVVNSSANYIASATSMLDADNKLDTQIKVNTDAITKLNANSTTTGSFAKGDADTLISAKSYTDTLIGDATVNGTANNTLTSRITTALNTAKSYTDTRETAITTATDGKIGVLSTLTTTAKTTLVAAVNELKSDATTHTTIYGNTGIINYASGSQIEFKQTIQAIDVKASTSLQVKDENTTYYSIHATSAKGVMIGNAQVITESNIATAISNAGGVTQADITQLHTVLGTRKQDAAYVPPTGTTYISTATSVLDAEKKLDVQTKVNTDAIATKLTAANNLSELTDVSAARTKLSVMSTSEVNSAIDAAKLALGTNYSVTNITARNALVGLTVGDVVFVTDDGDGHWATYRVTVVSPLSFVKIMDEDTLLNTLTQVQITKLDGVESGAQVNKVTSVAGKIGAVTLVKSDITDFNGADYEPADTTILKSASIGVSVQGYDVNTVKDASYVHTDNNYTTDEKSKLGGIEIGAQANTVTSVAGKDGAVTLVKADITDFNGADYEPADATILKDADIGVSVQGYDATTVKDVSYVHTDNNYTTDEKSKLGGIEIGAQVNTVTSVAGKTGVVALVKADITDFNENDYQPKDVNIVSDSNYSHISVTATSVSDGTTTFSQYTHPTEHSISEITNLQTELDNKVNSSRVLTDVPVNAVFTDTVYTHPDAHPISMITDLQTTLDSKADKTAAITLSYIDYVITATDVSNGNFVVGGANLTGNVRIYIDGKKIKHSITTITDNGDTTFTISFTGVVLVEASEVEIEIITWG